MNSPKSRWTTMERGELFLIAVVMGVTWFLSSGLSWSPQVKWLFAYSAALILGQGLARDLVRLAVVRRSGETRRIVCLCAESTLGLTLLLGGSGGLYLLDITQTKTLTQNSLTVVVGVLLLIGFVAKDYVLSIRRERDHASILIW